MNNIIIRRFLDLDNTIIFSHRRQIGEKIPVEYYNDKEQSYMPVDAYRLLQESDTDSIIPLTSRTLAQYDRIHFFEDERILHYALLDNGGILLINGKEDIRWTAETMELIGADLTRMKILEEQFSKFGEIKLQDGIVYFLKLADIGDMPRVSKLAKENNLMLFNHMNKVYICSQKLSKGNAIKRFIERYGADYVISAGDTWVDVSMMEYSDYGVYANELKDVFTDDVNVRLVENDKIFIEAMKRRFKE